MSRSIPGRSAQIIFIAMLINPHNSPLDIPESYDFSPDLSLDSSLDFSPDSSSYLSLDNSLSLANFNMTSEYSK
jgi:hypothetical protein